MSNINMYCSWREHRKYTSNFWNAKCFGNKKSGQGCPVRYIILQCIEI